MRLAQATICHATKERLRLRIGDRKGDRSYLTGLEAELKNFTPAAQIETSIMTASVLIRGCEVDIEALAAFGQQKKLFELKKNASPAKPLVKRIEVPARDVDRMIQRFTDGRLNLMSIVITALISMGIVEFIRGNRRMPPWYTAFWYAFSILALPQVDKSPK